MFSDRPMRALHRLAERSGLAAMVRRYLAGLQAGRRLDPGSRLLLRIRHSPAYPLGVGVLAVISAGTSLYPFGPVIVAATVFAPGRWRAIVVAAALGATLGATGLTLTVRGLGLELAEAWFPAVRDSGLGERSAYWLARHGGLALGAIAALPVPQLPAIVLAGLSDMHPGTVALALLLGKLVKYVIYVRAVVLLLRGMRRVAEWEAPPPG